MLNIIYCSKEIKWQLTNHVQLLLNIFNLIRNRLKGKEKALFYCQSINQNVQNDIISMIEITKRNRKIKQY